MSIASTQSTPGYMDADYYYATGIQLAEGKGFTEPFLWNYLDNPSGLPHPSHAYWMPLASILSALGIRLAPGFGFDSAQMAFILLSALIPLITAALAFSLTRKRDLALISALLALFSGYYAPFLTTTDTFSIYMLLGGSFFLTLNIRKTWLKAIALGLIAALMHLSRADGAIWLVIAALALITHHSSRPSLSSFFFPLFVLAISYLLLISPWLYRNLITFGAALAPGGDQMLWLTSYDQIFSYPAGSLSMETWLASGWGEIIKARLWALSLNLGTTLGVQGGIILLPFIIWGAWKERKKQIVYTGIFAWATTFLVMTVIFPFAGARGGFFHSGAALQPLWWALAPVGLERAIAWIAKKRRWRIREARQVFLVGLVGMSVLLTGAILWGRVLSPVAREQAQNEGVPLYVSIEKIISAQEGYDGRAVIVSNPPGYFLASERNALALPDGDAQTVLAIAERYNAGYLILEEGGVTKGLLPLFDAPETEEKIIFLKQIEGAKIFVIETK
ncbi:MAG: hypothetical protein HN390_04265 [Anaerolineae bacterium]|nr:hypothetical protein [Anaerolineae bacterium]MBT7189473.1 hypothetical protein [Anaerolineae bacterium]